MIKLAPPLPFRTAANQGCIHAISQNSIEVTWDSPNDSPPSNEIIVTIGNLQFEMKISSWMRNAGAIEIESSAVVTDLLHVIRKSQHLNICATEDVEHSTRKTGLDAVELPVVALPDLDFSEISTTTSFMKTIFDSPLLITGMTGGVAQASVINRRLAYAAEKLNIPMGVGSQRIALENEEHASIFRLKNEFPNLFLVGNIGISQLRSPDFQTICLKAVQMIDANALAIHVNVLQELIQVEGDRDFRGIIDKIGRIASTLPVPVIVKEVGAGLDPSTAKKLYDRGIRFFDIGGSGGTSWAKIEGLRSSDPMIQRRGEIFRDWGISTAVACKTLRHLLPDAQIIATGGIRNGLQVMKAIHIGANMTGMGLPLMKAAMESEHAVIDYLESTITELKIAMICSGRRAINFQI